MNELFAIEPSACESAAELKWMLSGFGPFAGRYIGTLPARWLRSVEETMKDWSPVEQARGHRLLHLAREQYAVQRLSGVPFDDRKSWRSNLQTVQSKHKCFAGAILNRSEAGNWPSIEDWDPSPTADEAVTATATEYVRVSRALLRISPELALVDAYFDITKQSYERVLSKMMVEAAKGACQGLFIWALASKQRSDPSSIRRAISDVARSSDFAPRPVKVHLVNDAIGVSKLHARYLISIRGGIRFDFGFQELRRGAKVDISVVGKALHNDLVKTFFEEEHDFSIEETIHVA